MTYAPAPTATERTLVDIITSTLRGDERIMAAVDDFVLPQLRGLVERAGYDNGEPDPATGIMAEALTQTAVTIAEALIAHGVHVIPGGFKPGQRVKVGANFGDVVEPASTVRVKLDSRPWMPLDVRPDVVVPVDEQAVQA
ncbi:hypothetical protein [Amycolatopsis kentuckyensis]|uniref:hypothetical protein n=1 Tax=Amycolatopsis kentuckyensis TaxID=218823 RepID=UPI0035688A6A